MTNQAVKRTAQNALKAEYGFTAPLQDIIIIKYQEEEKRAKEIHFWVNGNEYHFKSHIEHIGQTATTWCGKGSITKM